MKKPEQYRKYRVFSQHVFLEVTDHYTLAAFFSFLLSVTSNAAEIWKPPTWNGTYWVGTSLCLDSSLRTWTSFDGTYTIEAKLLDVSVDGKVITLLKKDGKEIGIALEKISKEGQEFVSEKHVVLFRFFTLGNLVSVIPQNEMPYYVSLSELTETSQVIVKKMVLQQNVWV